MVAALALPLLLGACAGLAVAGPGLVPAAGEDPPSWLLGAFGDGLELNGGAWLGLLGAAFLAYLALLTGAARLGLRRVGWITAGLVVLFAVAPPLLSADVFSYIAYARLGVEHGLNPYSAVPADVPGDPVYDFVGWRDAVSAYGPLFTLGTYPLSPLGVPASLWLLKVAAALGVAVTAWATARIAAARGVDPAFAVATVALNPLVLAHVVGGAHNDALMVGALAVGALALVRGWDSVAGGLLVAATAIKSSAAFLVPFALIGSGSRSRFALGGAAAAAAIGGAALIVFGADFVEALGLVGENQARTSHYSVPSQLSRLLGADVDVLRTLAAVLYLASVAWLLVWTWRGADWIRAGGWAGLGLLLATGWLLPWYVVWALPLAAVSRDRALLGATLALTAFQLANRVPL